MDKRIVIVTGACGGIGYEIVKKFLKENYHVVMFDVNEEALKATKEKLDNSDCISYEKVDISNEKNVKETLEKVYNEFGRIDSLINTAGICGLYAKTIDYPFDNFEKIYRVNVFGTFLMMKYTLPYMVKAKKGSIVNFGSVSGMRGYDYEVGYGSSKWAIIGMTRSVATEYGADGIRVNSISPGWVNTNMMKKTLDNYHELGTDSINLGVFNRPCEPYEIANCVYFLCSDEASYITGSNLLVDGGMLAG